MADSNNWVVVDATSLGYPGEKRWYNKATGEYRLSREGYFDPAGGTGSPSDMRAIGNVFNGLWQGVSDHFDPTSAKYQKPVSNYDIHQGADLNPAVYLDGTGGNLDRNTPVQPGSSIGPNAIQITPRELAQESEARRMMQQYASDEYWDTEAGKVMMDLGSQESYEGDNLAEFYNAQQAVGTGTIDEIIDGMGYTGNMEAWAKANPALALREYQKNSEALPTDGYAGYGTGELQVDERLKDVTNQFLQQQVDQLKDREDGPLWGPGPGEVPPVVQTQEQAPNLPGFPLPSQADGLSELLQSLGTREILNQIDETGGSLAEQAGEWYGRKKAQEVPGANLPFIGPWILDKGGERGAEKGREYWNQYTGPFFQ